VTEIGIYAGGRDGSAELGRVSVGADGAAVVSTRRARALLEHVVVVDAAGPSRRRLSLRDGEAYILALESALAGAYAVRAIRGGESVGRASSGRRDMSDENRSLA
jgi:hypothetical protein